MNSREVAPNQGQNADTDQGEPGLPREAALLFGRLRFVAAMLREAPPGIGPRLLWRTGDGRIHCAPIAETRIIGRSSDCDIVLTDPRISRRHGEIRQKGEAVWLMDLNSTLGTRVNGVPVFETELRDGDFVEMGGVPLAFVAGDRAAG
jgi:hypothetical protein